MLEPRTLKVGDIVKHHEQFYEVDKIEGNDVHLCTFTASMINSCGTLAVDSNKWKEVSLPKGKKDQDYIAAVKRRRDAMMPKMHHDAVRLPDGTVHVQNWISGMYGGSGQHHVHTAKDYAEWAKGIDADCLTIRGAEKCCSLVAGQTREYNGKVWSKDSASI